MKSIINSIWSFFDSVDKARYAAFLTRQGRIQEARAIYEK